MPKGVKRAGHLSVPGLNISLTSFLRPIAKSGINPPGLNLILLRLNCSSTIIWVESSSTDDSRLRAHGPKSDIASLV